MRQLFHWHGFDATALLPRGWQDELHQIAGTWAVRKDLVATSVTSRETPGAVIPVTTVDGGDLSKACLLYTSDAADERSSVDLGGRRIIKKKKKKQKQLSTVIHRLLEHDEYTRLIRDTL